jgi:uncharacterized protein YPO0396
MALEAIVLTLAAANLADSRPPGMAKRRITKRSVDADRAPETGDAMTELAYTVPDTLELASAREKILELKYEIESLKAYLSSSYVERLKAELSHSYATNREFRRQLEDESEENEKLKAGLKHEREENEKLSAGLKNEREENEKLNAELKIATLANGNLIDLSRSQSEQTDRLTEILETVADWVERWPCPLRLPEIIDGEDDLGEVVTDDLAA